MGTAFRKRRPPARGVCGGGSIVKIRGKNRPCGLFAKGDQLLNEPTVVSANSFESVAFVLPAVENGTDEFPLRIDDAEYFLVLPPQSGWKDIGWE